MGTRINDLRMVYEFYLEMLSLDFIQFNLNNKGVRINFSAKQSPLFACKNYIRYFCWQSLIACSGAKKKENYTITNDSSFFFLSEWSSYFYTNLNEDEVVAKRSQNLQLCGSEFLSRFSVKSKKHLPSLALSTLCYNVRVQAQTIDSFIIFETH